MTTLRAVVFRSPRFPQRDTDPLTWNALVYIHGAETGPRRLVARQSWPEAMQAAYKLRADLDAELMNEVHASRATRRAEQTITEYIENGHPTELEATA